MDWSTRQLSTYYYYYYYEHVSVDVWVRSKDNPNSLVLPRELIGKICILHSLDDDIQLSLSLANKKSKTPSFSVHGGLRRVLGLPSLFSCSSIKINGGCMLSSSLIDPPPPEEGEKHTPLQIKPEEASAAQHVLQHPLLAKLTSPHKSSSSPYLFIQIEQNRTVSDSVRMLSIQQVVYSCLKQGGVVCQL